ncbi:unnamed protein product, partial [Brenthis ino]
MFVNCIICDTFVHKVRGRKKVITSEEDARLYSDSSKKTVSVGDVLCGKCRLIIYNSKSNVASTSAASTLVECEGEQESGEHLAVGETSSNASFQQECEMNLPCSSESDHDDDDDGDDHHLVPWFICVDTVDQSIRQLQKAKLAFADSVLTGVKDTITNLNIEDLMMLFLSYRVRKDQIGETRPYSVYSFGGYVNVPEA